jgi:regulator of RNase E activity RraA
VVDATIAGLVGGFAGTVAMTIPMKAMMEGPTPTQVAASKVTGKRPERNAGSGMAMHLFYGTLGGLLLAVLVEALLDPVSSYELLELPLYGLGWGALLWVGSFFWMGILGLAQEVVEQPVAERTQQAGGMLGLHLLYGAVTGPVRCGWPDRPETVNRRSEIPPAMPASDDPRLERVTASSVTDAMGRHFDHPAHLPDLTTPTPDRTVFGPAATVRFVPPREDLAGDEHAWPNRFYEAVGDEPDGKVLVLGSTRRPSVTLAGGTKLSRLDHQGLAGAIVDGRVRDVHELAELDAAVWCRGEGLRWGGDRRLALEADVPVVVGEVTIAPGDWIYADGTGAVVVPGEAAEDVLDEAVAIEGEDEAYKEQVAEETPATVRGAES